MTYFKSDLPSIKIYILTFMLFATQILVYDCSNDNTYEDHDNVASQVEKW